VNSGFEIWNQTAFLSINAAEGTGPGLIFLAKVIGEYLIYLIPVFLTLCWLWGDPLNRKWLLKALIVAAFALFLNQGIGLIWQHPRPFVIGLGKTWIPHIADSSFPSDHVTLFASIGLVFLLDMSILLGGVTLALALCVAWARIFMGVHYPADMLGAFAVATTSYVAISLAWRGIGAPLTDVSQRIYRFLFALPIAAGWVAK